MNRLRAALQLVRPLLSAENRAAIGHWVSGLIAATLLLMVLSRLRLALGTSADVTVAMLVACTFAALTCLCFIRSQNRFILLGAFWLAAIWTVLQPTVLSMSLESVRRFTLEEMTLASTQFFVVQAIVLASLYPLACGLIAITTQQRRGRSAFLLGMATAMVFAPIIIGTLIPLQVMQWVAVAASVLAGAIVFVAREQSTAAPATVNVHGTRIAVIERLLLSVLLGVAFAIAIFVGRQLALGNLFTEFALLGGVLLGLPVGRLLSFPIQRTTAWLLIAVWGTAFALSYPWLTYLSLVETVSISSPFGLFTARALLLIAITFPIGLILNFGSGPRIAHPSDLLVACIGGTLGFALAIQSGTSVQTAILVLTGTSCSVALGIGFINGVSIPRNRITRSLWCAAACCLVFGSVFVSRLDPAKSENVIYSGNAFSAFRAGVGANALNWISDSRLADEFSNLESRVSFWKQRGAQFVVRQNGIAVDTHSKESAICPQNAAEMLPGLFALIAQPTAEHVLVLGAHTTTLHTCEAYPLRTVTVIDGTPHLMQIEDRARSRLNDQSRFRFVSADPHWALKTQHGQAYDIVLAPHSTSATIDGAAQLTQEFYSDVRSQLSDSGMFCQRIAFYDLGPETLQKILATAQSAFPQILVFESVPGEVLMIGAVQTSPLITADFIDRLQQPQVRIALGEIGWDWSIPASRGTLDDDAVREWVPAETAPFSNQEMQLAFQLPVEIARWDNKSQQTRDELAKKGMALGGYLGEESDRGLDIAQRLEDLQLAHKILSENPDHVWGYRTALKNQLSERPRSKIMQVKGEGLKRRLHPDDQHRKDYLVALSRVSKAEEPTLEMVDLLARYVQPFDPLLATFVSHEAYHQLKRIDSPTDRAQLQTLLHSIYFSTPADKSVRNVSAAMTILSDQDNELLFADERWDQLNGLCEVLRHRWQMRFFESFESKYETIDTERSIAATQLAIETMTSLAEEVGLTKEEWQHRRGIIEQNLLRPLKQHRSKQLRRYQMKPTAGE